MNIPRIARPLSRSRRATLTVSAILALAGLALILWPLVQPTPLALIAAMSIGQAIGSLSLAGYLFVVAIDLRRSRAFHRDDSPTIPPEIRKKKP